jgi:hydrogenase maturation protease
LSRVAANGIRPLFGAGSLIFGIGNCGRSDDGLGWAFLERISAMPGFDGRAEYRYQLGVEDAALAARAERVVFVDSYRGELPGGFRWARCTPSENFEFTSHVLPPRAVMHYCLELYGRQPHADLLMIEGVCWDLASGLSDQARENLHKAIEFSTARMISERTG